VQHLPLNIPIFDLALGRCATPGSNNAVTSIPGGEGDLTTILKTESEHLGPERGCAWNQASGVMLILVSVLTKRVNDHAAFGFAKGQSRTAIASAGGRSGVQD
jgi:hypothetical protein